MAFIAVCAISIGAIVGLGTSGHFETLQRQLQLDWRPWSGPSLNWLASPDAEPANEAVCQCQVRWEAACMHEVGEGVHYAKTYF